MGSSQGGVEGSVKDGIKGGVDCLAILGLLRAWRRTGRGNPSVQLFAVFNTNLTLTLRSFDEYSIATEFHHDKARPQ